MGKRGFITLRELFRWADRYRKAVQGLVTVGCGGGGDGYRDGGGEEGYSGGGGGGGSGASGDDPDSNDWYQELANHGL